MPIRPLPELLVNQIAAGEVIERPASVVKELLENAVDAGAGRIEVVIRDGGRSLIRVADDGAGIPADELPLAPASHATSKITGVDDLFRIGTLGFRGEALASIGAVSRLRIVSRPPDATAGHEIVCEGGTVTPVRPASAPPGTTVEVERLFYNTPARRKFLRTDGAEFTHIAEQVMRVALPYPGVRFRLEHNGRTVYDMPAAPDARARVEMLLGGESAAALVPVESARGGVTISGWAAAPRESRSADRWQYLFLNGRYVRDRLLMAALREAYRGMLESHRRPVAVIFLSVDPADVDVNVHPTKVEVRFRNGGAVYRELMAAVREALLAADLAPGLRIPAPTAAGIPEGFADASGAMPWDAGLPDAGVAAAAGSPATDGDLRVGPPAAGTNVVPVPNAEADRVRAAMTDFLRRLDPARNRVAFQPLPRHDPPGRPGEGGPPPSWAPASEAGRAAALLSVEARRVQRDARLAAGLPARSASERLFPDGLPADDPVPAELHRLDGAPDPGSQAAAATGLLTDLQHPAGLATDLVGEAPATEDPAAPEAGNPPAGADPHGDDDSRSGFAVVPTPATVADGRSFARMPTADERGLDQAPGSGGSGFAPAFTGAGRTSAPATASVPVIGRTALRADSPAGPLFPPAGRRRYKAAQFHDTFIVVETATGLDVIDQHALHERLLYEKFKARLAGGGPPAQRLLIPEPVDLPPRLSAVLEEHRDLLVRMGVEADPFGAGGAAVHAVPGMMLPGLLRRAGPGALLRDLLEMLAEREGRGDAESLLHAAIDMAACKAAIKAGDPLTPEEIDALLAERDRVAQHHTCAHGRPTSLSLSCRELERQFKRH